MTTAAHQYSSPGPAVIVASANPATRQHFLQQFMGARIPVAEAFGGADAIGQLESSECQLLLLDNKLPDLDAADLLGMIHTQFPGIDVLLLDDGGQPLPPLEWRSSDAQELYQAIARWRGAPPARPAARETEDFSNCLPGIIGQTAAMHRVHRMVRMVAAHNTPVLVTGPTGTGKELVAAAIHELSPRAAKPMVVINCSAIPEALLEAELFGYARGAFTGAVQSSVGRIARAHGGTLFLDEIGDLPLGMQAKLLRFMDKGELQRLGSSEVLRVDVRIIAATNADLAEMSRQRLFRDDLYYRLSVFPIELPPLAERPGDVRLLAEYFVRKIGGLGGAGISSAAACALEQHAWPGNVRELEHVIERALILAEDQPIMLEHLGLPGHASGQEFTEACHFA